MLGWVLRARPRGPSLRPPATIALSLAATVLGSTCGPAQPFDWKGRLLPVDCPRGVPVVTEYDDRAAVVVCQLPWGGQSWHVCTLHEAQAACHALRDKPLGIPYP